MAMKKNWYKKTVLSYIPTLYLTIAIVVFIAIFVVSEVSMKEAERTNKYSMEYIVNTLETSLMSVERRMLEELRFGDVLFSFFEQKGNAEDRMLNYEVNKKLRQFVTEFPIIHSMYLYRIEDNMVLSLSAYESLSEFGDQAYVLNELERYSFDRSWSLPRSYSDGVGIDAQHVNVISFSQRTQLPMGNQGILVVNVSLDALLANINKMIDPGHTFLQITAGDDLLVYSSAESGAERHEVMNELGSDYMQWHFTSGIQTHFSFASLQMISRIWIAVGVICIIASFIYTLLITKRNYRPIENIISQIQSFQNKRAVEKGAATDEFSFIQKAIERLNDENMQYEAEVQEANQHKRKQLFLQLLESSEALNERKWKESLERLGYPSQVQHAYVTVIEIDHYAEFEGKYKKSYDQGLIKFAMSNVLQEYLHDLGWIWSEWTRLNRMPVIHCFDRELQQEWLARLEKFRVWVAVNLGLTVTIGVGERAEDWGELHRSYHEAVEALHYKMSCGRNCTLAFQQVARLRSNNIHIYYQEMNALAHDFRLGNSDWGERAQATLSTLQQEVLTNEENVHLLQYFKSLLEQLLEKLPLELQQHWSEQIMPEWNLLMRNEYLGEIVPRLQELLQQAHHAYLCYVKSKDSKQTIHGIRAFVEENYMNPELSLNLISEKFKLNSKYISQLFKEQLGINFADFVMELRIEQAKRLLLVTDGTINEISSQVGYEIPLSFGRAFKKQVGVSPSDYRKNMSSIEQLEEAVHN